MIKRTIALAVLATLASGAAFAQSSVTLYGRLNVTAEREKVGSEKAVYALGPVNATEAPRPRGPR